MIMLLVFTFSMSTTAISKRKFFFFDRYEKVTKNLSLQYLLMKFWTDHLVHSVKLVQIPFPISLKAFTTVSVLKCSQISFKVGALKKFATFTEKHLCRSLFFTKMQAWRPITSLKKGLQCRYFPVNITFFREHLRWLLLFEGFVLKNTSFLWYN